MRADPSPPPPLRLTPRAVVIAFGLTVIAGIWAFTVHQTELEKQAATDNLTNDVHNMARAFDEHTARTIQSADQAVLFLKYQYERVGTRFDIAEYLATGVILGDIFNLLSIVDADADLVLSSKPFTKVNLADREHVRVHMKHDTGRLFVGKPVLGRVSGRWSIQMTRRINQRDGTFGGVVVASLDPQYFAKFYGDVNLGADGVVTLVGRDGVIRARQARGSDTLGQDLGGSALFSAMEAAGTGVFQGVSPVDGMERLYAWKALADYPLFVVVGVGVDEALRAYYDLRRQTYTLAGAMTVVIVLFTALLLGLIARLEGSRAKAEAASRAKSNFLANMSHELRTPLNGILGYAELLRDDLAGSPEADFAAAIHESGTHLLDLVNDVLDIGRIEAGHVEFRATPEDVRELVRQCAAGHLAAALAKGLNIHACVDDGVPARFPCDRTKVLRVLNNLVHNAVKFTDAGEVTIRVQRTPDGLEVSVTDTGPGIAGALQGRIFGRFEQGDDSASKRYQGTGLGLALCKELVTVMRGRLWVRSAPGHGATFHFTLPGEPAMEAQGAVA